MGRNLENLADCSNSLLDYPLSTEIDKTLIDKIRVTGDFNVGFIDEMMLLKDANLDFSHSEDFTYFRGFYQASNNERVHFEYNFIRAESLDIRNTWIEWNPAKFPDADLEVLKEVLFQYMNNVHLTRIDLAFDVHDDLSNYQIFKGRPIEHRSFYSNDSKLETRYIGSPNSTRHIKVYNKKLQLEKIENIYIEAVELWRFEITLKNRAINEFVHSLDSIELYLPNYEKLNSVQESAMLFYLLSDDNNWSKLNPKTRTKYRKIIKDTQDFNLTDQLRQRLDDEENEIVYRLNHYLGLFNTSNKVTVRPRTH